MIFELEQQDIDDVDEAWFQLASARQLGSESVSIAIVSCDRSARVFN